LPSLLLLLLSALRPLLFATARHCRNGSSRALMTATAHRTPTAYVASAKAAAVLPMSAPKPVKEINGIDLDRVEMGDEGTMKQRAAQQQAE
jgi:hypothetical protein